MANESYQKVNWGWLNDYNGYKFAPITFFEQLYTIDGYSFKDKYENQWKELESGKIIIDSAKKLGYEEIETDIYGNIISKEFIPYTTGLINEEKEVVNDKFSKYQPVYFKDGVPKICDNTLMNNIYGNTNSLMTTSEKQTLFNKIKSVMNEYESTLNTVEILSTKGGLTSSEQEQLQNAIDNLKILQDKLQSETTINGGTINGLNVNAKTLNGNSIYADFINTNVLQLTNPVTVNYSGDLSGVLQFNSLSDMSLPLTLTNSGVNAAKYGPENNTALNSKGQFIVPQFTVDSKGRLIDAKNITYTLPASVSPSLTINGKPLTGNINLTAADVGAVDKLTYSKSVERKLLYSNNDLNTEFGKQTINITNLNNYDEIEIEFCGSLDHLNVPGFTGKAKRTVKSSYENNFSSCVYFTGVYNDVVFINVRYFKIQGNSIEFYDSYYHNGTDTIIINLSLIPTKIIGYKYN